MSYVSIYTLSPVYLTARAVYDRDDQFSFGLADQDGWEFFILSRSDLEGVREAINTCLGGENVVDKWLE